MNTKKKDYIKKNQHTNQERMKKIMKYKTFILRLEDRSGHLLEVSKIISSHNANITRLSYNKVVDQHTVFVEVYADENDIKNLKKVYLK